MNRTSRRLWSWLALLAIVFAQLSGAAYACPASEVQAMAAGTPCDMGAQDQNANLCDKHCNDHQQSSPSVVVPAPFAASFVAFMAREGDKACLASVAAELQHPISPPATVSHCRWRI